MTTLNASAARRGFFSLVKRANKGHQVFRINHPKGSVVMLSEGDYENMLESLELLSIPGFRDSIKRSAGQVKKGQTLAFNEVFGEDQ